MEPVYGQNLRQAVKITLLLSADLHEAKRHRYVDRRSKFSHEAISECYSVPSAVFNSFALGALQRQGTMTNDSATDSDYEPAMCKVTDWVAEIPLDDAHFKADDPHLDAGNQDPKADESVR